MPTYLSPGVYVQEVEAGTRPIEGVGTAVAAFVGLAQKGPANQPTLVSNWTQFTETFGDFVPGSYLALSVYGYFLNGGGNCYVVRVGANGNGNGNGSGNGKQSAVQSAQQTRAVAGPPMAEVAGYRIITKSTAANPKPVSVEIADPGGENPSEDQFKITITAEGRAPEVWDNVTTKRGPNNVATKVSAESKIVTIEEVATGGALTKPDRGTVQLVAPEPEPPMPTADEVGVDDYVGDSADRTGFGGLEAVDGITMVAVPDLMAAFRDGRIDLKELKAVQLAAIAHCELMGDRVAIIDPPPSLNAQQIKEWRMNDAGYDSAFAALYWPWVEVFDPSAGKARLVPPSGHIAGVWARNDDTRGVHKAPANEVIRGVLSLETQITKTEQELLNPIGVNCIRSFPGRGIRVWGARTLSSDAEWRYLNVRRLFNYLEASILLGTQWAVFEPNDPALWARIRRTISAFLTNEWRKGALFGLTPEQAFFVQCDSETNPAEGIDAGQVVCKVGVAPVKPAEFVIFQLSQFSGGTSLVSE